MNDLQCVKQRLTQAVLDDPHQREHALHTWPFLLVTIEAVLRPFRTSPEEQQAFFSSTVSLLHPFRVRTHNSCVVNTTNDPTFQVLVYRNTLLFSLRSHVSSDRATGAACSCAAFITAPLTPHLCKHRRYNCSDTMLKVPRWLENALSLDGTLDKKEWQKRVLFFAFNVIGLFFVMMNTAVSVGVYESRPVSIVGGVCYFTGAAIGLGNVLMKRQLTTRVVVTVAYIYVAAILLIDVTSRTLGMTVWATLVLVVDLLLVMQVPQRYTAGIVLLTIVWLIVMSMEEGFRFGVFDLPGLVPQEGENGRKAHFSHNCAELPCASDTSQQLIHALAVFVIDFVVTRQFARDILREQKSMERTISTVQEIASLLAGYDVEKVAHLLGAHEHELPEGMTTALRSLEQNLRVYKAYLPQTCLPFERRVTEAFRLEVSCYGSVSSHVSSPESPAASGRRKTMVPQALDLSFTSATLLTLNIKDTLHRLEEDSARFSDLFTTLLQKTLQATEVRRGMVDVFVGDRIHCSFNASKQCAPHASSALHAAILLLRGGDAIAPHVNMGVATGKVLRGDMGCAVMRRFSMVGALVRDVNVLERAGRVLGCSVLCNRLCFSDAECEHHLRLVPCKVEVGESREEIVAELVVSKEAAAQEEGEWMYMLEGNKQWEQYNIAMRGYLRGNVSAAAAATAVAAAIAKVDDNTDCNIPEFSEVCEVLQLPVQTRRIANMNTNSSNACVK